MSTQLKTKVVTFGLVAIVLASTVLGRCPFCGQSVKLRNEMAATPIIVVGSVGKTRMNGKVPVSDFTIKKILKDTPKRLKVDQIITVTNILVNDSSSPIEYVGFVDVYKGELDLYRGIPVSKDTVAYVAGLIQVNVKDPMAIAKHCFEYLGSSDNAVSSDALAELQGLSDQELTKLASVFSASKLRKWIQDDKLPLAHRGWFCYLLGMCGEPADFKLLKEAWYRMPVNSNEGRDSILVGSLLVDKTNTLPLLHKLSDSANDFLVRYAVLRTVRYAHEYRPKLIPETDLLTLYSRFNVQKDIADLSIENLRRMKCWKLTGEVLSLYEKQGFDTPEVRRNLFRYASQCPDPKCAEFLAKAKKTHGHEIEQMVALLKAESR